MSYPNKAARQDANLKALIDPAELLGDVAAIENPATATAEDIAEKVNEILLALQRVQVQAP